MVIGTTETGDAGLDLSWTGKLGKVDAALLITKRLTDDFLQAVMQCREKVMVHATCTGYGGTILEPRVPDVAWQLSQVRKLLAAGFPAEQLTVRIDPIIPTARGLQRAQAVVDGVCDCVSRFRISVLDMYPHVRKRFVDAGLPLPYGNRFSASDAQFALVDAWLACQRGKGKFSCCAEPKLQNCTHEGCVSEGEIRRLGLKLDRAYGKGFQRKTCTCLGCKRQMLSGKGRCAHGCLYCYWKDEKAGG